MTQAKEKILQVFKDFKTPANGILKPISLDTAIRKWDRRSQDEAQTALQELMQDDFISTKENWYVLTNKGYNHIYAEYSIDETERIILNVPKLHKVGIGDIIIPNWFIGVQQSMERFHFDNYNQALQNIIDKGYFEVAERGWKLTEKGYNKIY